MPEASINEYHSPSARKYKVWPARQLANMKAISEPHTMQALPHDDFWPRVLTSNCRHHAAAYGGTHYVGHSSSRIGPLDRGLSGS